MLQNTRRTYALQPFTVERRTRGWYYGHYADEKSAYKGPYSSIASVTLMIARRLRKETERRDKPYTLDE